MSMRKNREKIMFQLVKDFYNSLPLVDKYVMKILFYHEWMIKEFKEYIS
jgi:hypothetical protein